MAAVEKPSRTALQDELAPWFARPADVEARLDDPSWHHVSGTSFESLTKEDWGLLETRGNPWYEGRHVTEMLAMLSATKDATSYGWHTNNYGHSLQTATRALNDGADEEMVVVALLHDIGQTIAPNNHGEMAATLLRPFVSPVNHWLLKHHTIFQRYHRLAHPTSNRMEREKWRGHPAFETTALFCERWDQPSMDPNYPTLPLEAFEPVVRRVLGREPHFTDPM